MGSYIDPLLCDKTVAQSSLSRGITLPIALARTTNVHRRSRYLYDVHKSACSCYFLALADSLIMKIESGLGSRGPGHEVFVSIEVSLIQVVASAKCIASHGPDSQFNWASVSTLFSAL